MVRLTRIVVLCVLLTAGVATTLPAQESSAPDTPQSPRFLLVLGSAGRPTPVEPGSTPALQKLITLNLQDATLGEVLQEVATRSGIHLMYSSVVAPLDQRVQLQADGVSVASVLIQVLQGTGVDVMFVAPNRATLVRREPQPSSKAQQKAGVIAGRVTEEGTNNPIAGAQIQVDSVGRGVTNAEGLYRITGVAPGKRTVSVLSIGHRGASQEVEVGEGATVVASFSLVPAPTQLSELVVTASGEKVRRVELGHDIVVINADSIVANEPVSSMADLLEGRVPGLVVQRSSGTPGDPTRIRIRGVSSALMSNDPIIIVDGVRVYSEQSGRRGANLATARYASPSPLDYMSPSMVETVQVIKGPSAATMYGQDAANGVIVITTKKGLPGKAQWTVSVDHGMVQPARKFTDRYVRLGRAMTDDRRVVCPANGWVGGTPASGETCIPDDEVASFQALRDPELSVLGRGRTSNLNVGVSGGVSAITYTVNASYFDEQGVVKLSDFETQRFRSQHGREPFDWMRRPQNYTRWSVQSKVQTQVGSALDISLSSIINRSEQQRSELENKYIELDDVYIDKSTGVYYKVGGQALGGATAILMPVDIHTDFYERVTARATRFTNSLNLNWRPRTWLTVNADAGLSVDQRVDDAFIPSGFDLSAPHRADGSLSRGNGNAVTSTLNLTAFSRVPLGRGFRFQLSAGVNYKGEGIGDMHLGVDGLPEGVSSITSSTTGFNLSGSENRSTRATYGWHIAPGISHRRMWLDFGLRFDGGSTFGTNVKLPTFPKLSYSYLISDEPYFPDALRSIFDQLRLRVAYGHAGQQPGPTDRLRLYTSANLTRLGGKRVEAVSLHKIGNPDLRPERSQEFEGGFEANLFNDRVAVSFTAYHNTTNDAILDVPIAPSVYGGNVTRLQNFGVVRNKGIEAFVGFEAVRSDLVTWRLDLNFDQNHNEVVKLGAGVEPFWLEQERLTHGFGFSGVSGIRVVPGFPVEGRWITPVLGYSDSDGNGILDDNEVVFGDTAVYVGNTAPNYTAALQSTLSLFRGVVSVTANITFNDGLTQWNRSYNPALARGWHDPSSTSLFDQLQYLDKAQFTRIETVYALRLNSLTVGWQMPRPWAGRLGAKSLKLSVQGTNLGLLTNYSGLDPNVNSALGSRQVMDQAVLPEPRSFQFRLNASY